MMIFMVIAGAWVLCALVVAMLFGRSARVCAKRERNSRQHSAPTPETEPLRIR